MSVLVDNDTQLVRLRHHRPRGHVPRAEQPRYGTNVVGGVTPGKGGQDVEGVPVFNTFHDAVERDRREHGDDLRAAARSPPTRSSRPPTPASRRSSRSPRASPPTTSCASTTTSSAPPGTRLIGPNCPGVLSPGKANVGIIPASFFKEGNVGVVSRSGTLTYQIGNELAQRGFGNSSIVGIGGDPVPGSSFIDIIALFEADPRDRADRDVRRDRRRRPRRRPPSTSPST